MCLAEHQPPEGRWIDAADESHGLGTAGALGDERLRCGRSRWGEHAEEVPQACEYGLRCGDYGIGNGGRYPMGGRGGEFALLYPTSPTMVKF